MLTCLAPLCLFSCFVHLLNVSKPSVPHWSRHKALTSALNCRTEPSFGFASLLTPQ